MKSSLASRTAYCALLMCICCQRTCGVSTIHDKKIAAGHTFFNVLFMAPVTPELQCEPKPTAVTKSTERSFIVQGTWEPAKLSSPFTGATGPTGSSATASRSAVLARSSSRELFESPTSRVGVSMTAREAASELREGRSGGVPANQIRLAAILYHSRRTIKKNPVSQGRADHRTRRVGAPSWLTPKEPAVNPAELCTAEGIGRSRK